MCIYIHILKLLFLDQQTSKEEFKKYCRHNYVCSLNFINHLIHTHWIKWTGSACRILFIIILVLFTGCLTISSFSFNQFLCAYILLYIFRAKLFYENAKDFFVKELIEFDAIKIIFYLYRWRTLHNFAKNIWNIGKWKTMKRNKKKLLFILICITYQ